MTSSCSYLNFETLSKWLLRVENHISLKKKSRPITCFILLTVSIRSSTVPWEEFPWGSVFGCKSGSLRILLLLLFIIRYISSGGISYLMIYKWLMTAPRVNSSFFPFADSLRQHLNNNQILLKFWAWSKSWMFSKSDMRSFRDTESISKHLRDRVRSLGSWFLSDVSNLCLSRFSSSSLSVGSGFSFRYVLFRMRLINYFAASTLTCLNATSTTCSWGVTSGDNRWLQSSFWSFDRYCLPGSSIICSSFMMNCNFLTVVRILGFGKGSASIFGSFFDASFSLSCD